MLDAIEEYSRNLFSQHFTKMHRNLVTGWQKGWSYLWLSIITYLARQRFKVATSPHRGYRHYIVYGQRSKILYLGYPEYWGTFLKVLLPFKMSIVPHIWPFNMSKYHIFDTQKIFDLVRNVEIRKLCFMGLRDRFTLCLDK